MRDSTSDSIFDFRPEKDDHDGAPDVWAKLSQELWGGPKTQLFSIATGNEDEKKKSPANGGDGSKANNNNNNGQPSDANGAPKNDEARIQGAARGAGAHTETRIKAGDRVLFDGNVFHAVGRHGADYILLGKSDPSKLSSLFPLAEPPKPSELIDIPSLKGRVFFIRDNKVCEQVMVGDRLSFTYPQDVQLAPDSKIRSIPVHPAELPGGPAFDTQLKTTKQQFEAALAAAQRDLKNQGGTESRPEQRKAIENYGKIIRLLDIAMNPNETANADTLRARTFIRHALNEAFNKYGDVLAPNSIEVRNALKTLQQIEPPPSESRSARALATPPRTTQIASDRGGDGPPKQPAPEVVGPPRKFGPIEPAIVTASLSRPAVASRWLANNTVGEPVVKDNHVSLKFTTGKNIAINLPEGTFVISQLGVENGKIVRANGKLVKSSDGGTSEAAVAEPLPPEIVSSIQRRFEPLLQRLAQEGPPTMASARELLLAINYAAGLQYNLEEACAGRTGKAPAAGRTTLFEVTDSEAKTANESRLRIETKGGPDRILTAQQVAELIKNHETVLNHVWDRKWRAGEADVASIEGVLESQKQEVKEIRQQLRDTDNILEKRRLSQQLEIQTAIQERLKIIHKEIRKRCIPELAAVEVQCGGLLPSQSIANAGGAMPNGNKAETVGSARSGVAERPVAGTESGSIQKPTNGNAAEAKGNGSPDKPPKANETLTADARGINAGNGETSERFGRDRTLLLAEEHRKAIHEIVKDPKTTEEDRKRLEKFLAQLDDCTNAAKLDPTGSGAAMEKLEKFVRRVESERRQPGANPGHSTPRQKAMGWIQICALFF